MSPGSTPLPLDLRSYRPAAVLVMDLVRHSRRDPSTSKAIQSIMTETVESIMTGVRLNDVHFNHTGDGYICTLLGDASARILDFINALYPILSSRLNVYGQDLRGGVAFGIVHLRHNPLTHSDTHFDLPGVEAARLQEVAKPGQILCTSTVFNIFSHRYPNMFSGELRKLETKDRIIPAYELGPYTQRVTTLRQDLTDFLFRRVSDNAVQREGAILIVDDDDITCKVLTSVLSVHHPTRTILVAMSGEQALSEFSRHTCALVITDFFMTGISGLEITARMVERVPDQIIVGFSVYGAASIREEFCRNGGFIFIPKVTASDDMMKTISYALTRPVGRVLRQELGEMCDNTVALWCILGEIAEILREILSLVGIGADIAQELLRHKAKHLVNDVITRLGPGVEPVESLRNLQIQMECVKRLARIVRGLGVQRIETFVDELVSDLKKMHSQITFEVISELRDAGTGINCGGVIILAIAELIDNAIAAIDETGAIVIKMSVLKTTGLLRITVKDSGAGVAEHIKARMFEEDVSTKGLGRGLGLHLVREAVRQLSGSVTYSFEKGSVFCIELPIHI